MKVVFMGTPEFAVSSLEALVSAGHDVCAVYTQPDKPKGRGYVMTPPPVKECAVKNNVEVFQPTSMKTDEEFERLSAIAPDIIVVVAYGKILPQRILDIPKYGCINVHASLLPKYRGAAPIQWAVIKGEKKSGVTIMQMDAGLDTGDMLLKAETDIGENETAGELHDELCEIGAKALIDALERIEAGTITAEKQPDGDFFYASMLDKKMCVVDWSENASVIHNKIRGLSPWPVALTTLNGKRVKLHESRLSQMTGGNCGEVISVEPFVVSCGDNTSVEIRTIQIEGGKKLDVKDFLRGHKIELGTIFGN